MHFASSFVVSAFTSCLLEDNELSNSSASCADDLLEEAKPTSLSRKHLIAFLYSGSLEIVRAAKHH